MATIAVEYNLFAPSEEEQKLLEPFMPTVDQLAAQLGVRAGTLHYGEIQQALLGLLSRRLEEDESFLVALAGVLGSLTYEVNSLLTMPPSLRPHGAQLRMNLEDIRNRVTADAFVWYEQMASRVHVPGAHAKHEWLKRLIETTDRLRPWSVDVTGLDSGVVLAFRVGDGGTILGVVHDPARGMVDLWRAEDDQGPRISSRIGSTPPGVEGPDWDVLRIGDELAMESFNTGRRALTHSIIMQIEMA